MSTTAEDMRFPGSHALGFIGGVSTTQFRMDEDTKVESREGRDSQNRIDLHLLRTDPLKDPCIDLLPDQGSTVQWVDTCRAGVQRYHIHSYKQGLQLLHTR